jgi:hypothetical protein
MIPFVHNLDRSGTVGLTFVQTIMDGADKLIAGCGEPTSGLEPLTPAPATS